MCVGASGPALPLKRCVEASGALGEGGGNNTATPTTWPHFPKKPFFRELLIFGGFFVPQKITPFFSLKPGSGIVVHTWFGRYSHP